MEAAINGSTIPFGIWTRRSVAAAQVPMFELALHFLRQLRLPNGNKKRACFMSDCVTRPECELAFAVSFGLHISDRMVW